MQLAKTCLSQPIKWSRLPVVLPTWFRQAMAKKLMAQKMARRASRGQEVKLGGKYEAVG